MTNSPEQGEGSSELFSNLEGIERGDALLNKLRDLLPGEILPEKAWRYGEFGQMVDIEYLADITMTIVMSENSDEAEKIQGQLYRLIKTEKTIRFTELLAPLNLSGFENINTDLDKFSTEEINRVENIANVDEAYKDVNRQLMNTAVNYYDPILNKILETTKVSLDLDQTAYPEFWNLYKRVDKMRTAVGILGKDSIRRIPRI